MRRLAPPRSLATPPLPIGDGSLGSALRRSAARHGVVPGSAAEIGDGGARGSGGDRLGAVCVLLVGRGGALPGSLGPDARPPHGAPSGRGGSRDRLGSGVGARGGAGRPAPARGAARGGAGDVGRRGDPGRGARALAPAAPPGGEPHAPGPRRGGRGEQRVPPCGPRCGRPGREAGGCTSHGLGGRPQRAPGSRGPLCARRAPGHRGWLSPAAGHPRGAGHGAGAGPGTESLG